MEITEEEAKEIDLVSVVTELDKYIIKWENEPLEEYVDSINKKTGDLKTIESSYGSCERK